MVFYSFFEWVFGKKNEFCLNSSEFFGGINVRKTVNRYYASLLIGSSLISNDAGRRSREILQKSAHRLLMLTMIIIIDFLFTFINKAISSRLVFFCFLASLTFRDENVPHNQSPVLKWIRLIRMNDDVLPHISCNNSW